MSALYRFYCTLLVESFAGTNFRKFANVLVVLEIYTREIVVFRSLAKVYTREIYPIFELVKFSENFRIVKVLHFWNVKYIFPLSHLSTFSALFTIDENEYFVFVQHREPDLNFESVEFWKSVICESLYPLNLYGQPFAKTNFRETQFWLWLFTKVHYREKLYSWSILPIK